MSAPCNKSFCSGWFTAPRVPNDWSSEVTSSWKQQREPATPKLPSKSPVDDDTVRRWRDRWHAAQARLQAIEATGKQKLLSQAIEVLLTDEQRPGAPATFTFEQFMQIMALACETPASADRPVSAWTPRELADEAVKGGIVEQLSPRTVERFLTGERVAAPPQAVLADTTS
jgi:putative transposase